MERPSSYKEQGARLLTQLGQRRYQQRRVGFPLLDMFSYGIMTKFQMICSPYR